jgi:hypothetical protein
MKEISAHGAIPDTAVLTTFQRRSQVTGNHNPVPSISQSDAEIITDVGGGHEQVNIVHALRHRLIDYRNNRLPGDELQIFGAQSDYAYLNTGSSQFLISHY